MNKTLCASGEAVDADGVQATEKAVASALEGMGARSPSLGFLFVSPQHDLGAALGAARAVLPDVDVMAATTAGELSDKGLSHGGVSCMLAGWGEAAHRLELADDLGEDAAELSRRLCPNFDRLLEENVAEGRGNSVTVLLGDGLSPMFERLVIAIRKATGDAQLVVGAGAGDEVRYQKTFVGANDRAFSGAVALHVFSRARWGVGVAHGLRPCTPRMTVTRAEGNTVWELDGKPARQVYRDYAAGRGIDIDQVNLSQFLVENELGVLLFEDVVRVRAPLRAVDGEGLFFAGEVPEGSAVCIVRGEPTDILRAARDAAHDALEGLDGARPAGILVFSCVCRQATLAERYVEELDAIREVFPDVPLAGFSSYGEVARTSARLDGYHNNTIVVAAIPE